jgi:hypothetical protein
MNPADSEHSQVPYLFESETKYFEVFPIHFVDRIINSINELIYSTAERFLTNLYGSEESSSIEKSRLEEGLIKLLTLMESSVDQNFDVFELYVLNNIFKFPESWTSSVDSIDINFNQILDGLVTKRARLLEHRRINKRLQHTLKSLENSHQLFEEMHIRLSRLLDCFSKESITSISLVRMNEQMKRIKMCIKKVTNEIETNYRIKLPIINPLSLGVEGLESFRKIGNFEDILDLTRSLREN